MDRGEEVEKGSRKGECDGLRITSTYLPDLLALLASPPYLCRSPFPSSLLLTYLLTHLFALLLSLLLSFLFTPIILLLLDTPC
jgi:hypothetical protein